MIWVEPMDGLEIPLRALLQGVGFTRFGVGPECPADAGRDSSQPMVSRQALQSACSRLSSWSPRVAAKRLFVISRRWTSRRRARTLPRRRL
jgi:hypothetical protein